MLRGLLCITGFLHRAPCRAVRPGTSSAFSRPCSQIQQSDGLQLRFALGAGANSSLLQLSWLIRGPGAQVWDPLRASRPKTLRTESRARATKPNKHGDRLSSSPTSVSTSGTCCALGTRLCSAGCEGQRHSPGCWDPPGTKPKGRNTWGADFARLAWYFARSCVLAW